MGLHLFGQVAFMHTQSQNLSSSCKSGLSLFTLVAASLLLSGCQLLPGNKSPNSGSSQTSISKPSPSARQCHADLKKANVRFSPLPNRNFNGGCSQIDSIALLDAGRGITLANIGPVKCEMASKFAAWTEFAVKRAAREYLDSDLERIETFGSYNCRNIAGTRKRSEHSSANAIDVSGFVLKNGRRITVLNGWNGSRDERQFLKAIHQSACKRFGTILSPDYNAAHRDHLHFDMAEYGSGKSFCR